MITVPKITQIQAGYALVQEFMHLLSESSQALSSGKDPNSALSKLTAHLESYTKTVDTVGQLVVPGIMSVVAIQAQYQQAVHPETPQTK